ncbi:hypothetical protein M0805_001982 [Coniferiporia weirii]|nr:hypothetical protein M0805_001982 [Coniferiporia weirii]
MEAHGKAYEDADVLHCDISLGNIMITEEGRRILIDWNLSEYIPNDLTFHGRPKLHNPLKSFSFMDHVIYANNEHTPDDLLEVAVSKVTTGEVDLHWMAEQENLKKAKKMNLMNRWFGPVAAQYLRGYSKIRFATRTHGRATTNHN